MRKGNNSPIHLESFALSLLPLTALTQIGLTVVTLISSSRRLNTETQYLPIDSMQTSKLRFKIANTLMFIAIQLLNAKKFFC